MKKCFAFAAAALLAVSCIYSYTPDLDGDVKKTIVVDGEILVGGTSVIRLSYLTPLGQSGSKLQYPHGRAWVEDEDGNRFIQPTSALSENIEIPTQNAVPGRRYRAVIEVDGNSYASEWLEAMPAPVIGDISFDPSETDVTVFVDVDAGESQSGYLGFSFEETWEFHSEFIPEYLVDPETWSFSTLMSTWPFYWCYRTVTSSQRILLDYSSLNGAMTRRFPITSFSRTDNRNHKRYSILVKAYALDQEAYLFNKNVREMSEMGGDLFTPDPGILGTNLTCLNDHEREVMGLVLAAEVGSKRAFMGADFYLPSTPNTGSFLIPNPVDYENLYYKMNYRPVMQMTIDENNGIAWGPHRCTNCLEAGGTQEKPDFWED